MAGDYFNRFGKGTLTYEGTVLSDTLQRAVVLDQLRAVGLTGQNPMLPAAVRVKHGVSNDGHNLHYYLNYSGEMVRVKYAYGAGVDLLTGNKLVPGAAVSVGPWDLIIAKEQALSNEP